MFGFGLGYISGMFGGRLGDVLGSAWDVFGVCLYFSARFEARKTILGVLVGAISQA